MTIYAVTLSWDDRYVVAPVEADNIAQAIERAHEWADDGGYDFQRTWDEPGPTYVSWITEKPTMDAADNAGPCDGACLPIPLEARSDSDKLAEVTHAARAMLAALKKACSELDPTLRPDPHTGNWSPAYTAVRAAIAQAEAAGIKVEG